MSEPSSPPQSTSLPQREVKFEHTTSFVDILERHRLSLLISTYQAGRLIVVGTHQGQLSFAFHSFEQVMGVAARSNKVAVGSKRQIWFLTRAWELAPRVAPAGMYDACYLTRRAHVTGEIHGHELAWAGEELWVVNTLFSCLCTTEGDYSFMPRWRPPFISALAAEDRCHLNGLALEGDKPRYVTALAETDTPAGWRPGKATSGCVIDVPTGATVARGFAMPHSPRLHNGKLWVLDSGKGQVVLVDVAAGRYESVAQLPGYTRGCALFGPLAFVGLSRIRETAVFSEIPLALGRDELQCGVTILDLRSGRTIASLRFASGVEEIFAVELLPGIRCPVLSGPNPSQDGGGTMWLVPEQAAGPAQAPGNA